MKVPFLRGGRSKEAPPMTPMELPSMPQEEDVDPYASLVSYYASGEQPIESKDGRIGVRQQLTEQLKKPEVVESLIVRIMAAREAKEQKPTA